jgi:hypothetical protein
MAPKAPKIFGRTNFTSEKFGGFFQNGLGNLVENPSDEICPPKFINGEIPPPWYCLSFPAIFLML